MLTELHISNPKSNIILKFRYRLFVQVIHFISYAIVDDRPLLSDTIFLKKKKKLYNTYNLLISINLYNIYKGVSTHFRRFEEHAEIFNTMS